jgi:uncharacterized repeat protein (TIGR02543 family)
VRDSTVNGDAQYGALANAFTYTLVPYALTVTATNGTVTKTPSSTTYDSGTVVGLKAHPSTGYHFVSWSGDASGTSDTTQVAMTAAKSVTANFAINTYTLTMAAIHGTTSPAIGPHTVDSNAATAIDNAPDAGYRFSAWSGAGVTFGDANSKSTTAAIGANATATATDTIIHYVLTMVNSTPAGTLSPAAGTSSRDTGVSVVISYAAPTGYHSTGFVLAGGAAFAGDSAHVRLSAAGSVTATCAADGPSGPTITSATPSHGITGQKVAILGSGFTPSDTVRVGKVHVFYRQGGTTGDTIWIPFQAAGSYYIRINDIAGHADSIAWTHDASSNSGHHAVDNKPWNGLGQ